VKKKIVTKQDCEEGEKRRKEQNCEEEIMNIDTL